MNATRHLLLAFGLCACLSAIVRAQPPGAPVPSVVEQAKTLTDQKQFAEAQKLLEEQLAQNPTQEQRVLLQNSLADVQFAWGESLADDKAYAQALPHFQAAYQSDKVCRPQGVARDLGRLGGAYYNLDRYEEALKYWQMAAPAYHVLGNQKAEAQTLLNIAGGYLASSHYEQAIRVSKQALAISQNLKLPRLEAHALGVVGYSYKFVKRYPEALQYLNQALLLSREDGDSSHEAWVLGCIGAAHLVLKHHEEALSFYQQEYSIYHKIGDVGGQTIALDNLGSTYYSLGQLDKALTFSKEALALSRKSKDHSKEAAALETLSAIYNEQRRYEEALRSSKEALAIRRRMKAREGEGALLTSISGTYAEQNQLDSAILYGKQMVNVYQSIRHDNQNLDQTSKRSYLAGIRGKYEVVAVWLIVQNRLEEAEQMLRFLRQEDALEFARRDPQLAKDLASLFEPLAFTATEKQQLPPEEAETIQVDEGCEESRLWQQALVEREKAGQGRAALITPFSAKHGFWVLLTTAKGRRVFQATSKKSDLDALSLRLQDALSHPNKDPRPDAQKMYDIVFVNGKLEQALQEEGITTALWFTSGSLRYIPIDALYDGKQYLVQKERANVNVTLTSRRLFAATAQGPTLAAGVSQAHTVEANGQGAKELSFNALKQVPHEVRSIVSDPVDGGTGPFPGTILLDKGFTAATLERSLAQGAATVHIATHFFLGDGNDSNSFLLLGDGTTLPLSRWKQALKLQGVGLLTLSACETGVGSPDATGGEVSSIGEVSQYLGAQSVIVSLWPVADASTATLMGDFYKRWHDHPQEGKAQALRETQRAMLGQSSAPNHLMDARGMPLRIAPQTGQTLTAPPFTPDPAHPYAHPFYWAPFSLIGNWK